MEEPPLGAFLVFRQEGEGWWGALLALDGAGIPREFLYAGPAEPTPAHRILYGPTLEGQLLLQALALPMWKALRAAPACALSPVELPGSLPAPLGVIEAGGVAWLQPATPEAARWLGELEGAFGLEEPLGRAEAALRYVIEHETGARSPGGRAAAGAPRAPAGGPGPGGRPPFPAGE
jgi:hypothetical protein